MDLRGRSRIKETTMIISQETILRRSREELIMIGFMMAQSTRGNSMLLKTKGSTMALKMRDNMMLLKTRDSTMGLKMKGNMMDLKTIDNMKDQV